MTEALSLLEGEGHVWRVALDVDTARRATLAETLSGEERDRAARFHFDRDRHRFQVARGALRHLLGRYLAVDPRRVEIRLLPGGKPILGTGDDVPLRFNVSHSGPLALIALARGREVGVDLEAERPLSDMTSLAESTFSPVEVAAWRALAPADRPAAFFQAWTRKEAFLKATGEGLLRALDSFDVALGPGEPARLLRVEGPPGELERWRLVALDVPRGYHAALAIEGEPDHVSCREWTL